MSRGRLEPPNLDDRTWKDIVNEAKALIPKYAPEWTDHNPSDLGITLIELFAWLVEGMIYRLNKVPEKNFIEFLNLLGVTRNPAVPASTYLTFGGASKTTVNKGSKFATQQNTATEEAIVFETDKDLTVLPINLVAARYITATNEYTDVTSHLVDSPLTGMKIDISSSQSIRFVLGFDSKSSEEISLLLRFSKQVKKDDIQITWLYSKDSSEPTSWPAMTVNDGTDAFVKNGSVSFTVPNEWRSQDPASWPDNTSDPVKQPLYWIGIKINNPSIQLVQLGLEHILFNSVSATNALTITQPELLGTSNGKPFQFFELKNRPLYKRPGVLNSYDHLNIEVREPKTGGGFGQWTRWIHLDDLPQGEGNCFRLDPVTGTIYFGNYNAEKSPDGYGTAPPLGSEIRAFTYRYVAGGNKGNVPAKTINVVRKVVLPDTESVTYITSVKNLGTAKGGFDEEEIEETKRRGPEVLRKRNRAVTLMDYEYLARESSKDIKKVRALPPKPDSNFKPWGFGGLNRSSGKVNVIIVPDALDLRPRPEENLINEVSDYLNQRRPISAHLLVTGPRYLPIKVVVTIKVWKSAIDNGLIENPAIYRDSKVDELIRFLHPTRGKIDGSGWEIGEYIYVNQVFAAIQPPVEIGFIDTIRLEATDPDYFPHNETDRPPGYNAHGKGSWILVADYEMVCYGGKPEDITVTIEQ
ncbi:MAG: hypothetical protein DWB56_05000 [Candidatus Jettenia sp.]|uniref:Baseplate protein J-like domain-containing protein n=1 Tax=Candidatus Jettenia caeni TaxID=247490 RepID=I3IIA3_9BACT|nr:baseplate J/gp47 family protein [Candidatus Jettenia sp. AMX1]MBC6928313.1 hypothetical protein [Candidatus Jettenia sp.]NUN21976.1 baseplate J/gp47 family protein [Candidatus Jettenia caeni]KAA0249926.1 MAG: hypothetical protein EDM77_06575 [Candidatus Jettenia sp. AMX1]MCE7880404.1 hypothetical protein [Candidatus Jettenia sp. AMX1]MCQ3926212.1 hypothetical protein [Candidatus Jettenia sp.]